MSAVPPVSRRVLTALRPSLTERDPATGNTTSATRAFVELKAALDAHTAALSALDRIEETVVTAYGYPRVPLPGTGTPPDYAADAATIVRRLGPSPTARRLTDELRRRQATFAEAAQVAGLDAAQA